MPAIRCRLRTAVAGVSALGLGVLASAECRAADNLLMITPTPGDELVTAVAVTFVGLQLWDMATADQWVDVAAPQPRATYGAEVWLADWNSVWVAGSGERFSPAALHSLSAQAHARRITVGGQVGVAGLGAVILDQSGALDAPRAQRIARLGAHLLGQLSPDEGWLKVGARITAGTLRASALPPPLDTFTTRAEEPEVGFFQGDLQLLLVDAGPGREGLPIAFGFGYRLLRYDTVAVQIRPEDEPSSPLPAMGVGFVGHLATLELGMPSAYLLPTEDALRSRTRRAWVRPTGRVISGLGQARLPVPRTDGSANLATIDVDVGLRLGWSHRSAVHLGLRAETIQMATMAGRPFRLASGDLLFGPVFGYGGAF